MISLRALCLSPGCEATPVQRQRATNTAATQKSTTEPRKSLKLVICQAKQNVLAYIAGNMKPIAIQSAAKTGPYADFQRMGSYLGKSGVFFTIPYGAFGPLVTGLQNKGLVLNIWLTANISVHMCGTTIGQLRTN